MQKRFLKAMIAYAVLALSATFTLDGKFRIGVWIFLAGLALKTVISYKVQESSEVSDDTGLRAEPGRSAGAIAEE